MTRKLFGHEWGHSVSDLTKRRIHRTTELKPGSMTPPSMCKPTPMSSFVHSPSSNFSFGPSTLVKATQTAAPLHQPSPVKAEHPSVLDPPAPTSDTSALNPSRTLSFEQPQASEVAPFSIFDLLNQSTELFPADPFPLHETPAPNDSLGSTDYASKQILLSNLREFYRLSDDQYLHCANATALHGAQSWCLVLDLLPKKHRVKLVDRIMHAQHPSLKPSHFRTCLLEATNVSVNIEELLSFHKARAVGR